MPFTDPVKWLKEHYKDSPLVLFGIEQNAPFELTLEELADLLKAYALRQCTCERRRRDTRLRVSSNDAHRQRYLDKLAEKNKHGA